MKNHRYSAWLGAAWLTLGLASATPVAAETVLKGTHEVVWKDFLGVNAQFAYFSPEVYQRQMDALDQLGLAWIRLTLHWPLIEPEKDKLKLEPVDAAMAEMNRRGYQVLAYLVGSAPFASSAAANVEGRDQYPPKDFEQFAARMADLAKRYPQVNTWQVWNEPNIVWRPEADPQGYGRLLKVTADAIRAAVPGKPVATAGMAYYSQLHDKPGYMLQSLVDGGLGQQDIVAAYHPYSEYPEGDSPADRDFLVRGNAMNKMLHDAGVRQVWATEWGWSSYAGPKEMQEIIGQRGQADYTLRRLALMSTMDYQRIFLFNLNDLDERATPRDQGYGLVDLQGNAKPVYLALQNFLNVTGPRLLPSEPPAVSSVPRDLYAVSWKRPDGSNLLMFWSAAGRSLTFPRISEAVLHDPLDGTRSTLSNAAGVTLALKPTLQILEWKP
ncbi:cellulase family glycosylhydrolase [uncultured Pseudomonas sp.]|uniref:cellulase family glycosylhydrolase n=1 Tax=uncultured Pseudomonas sp. TaxID=114707 RepID=UPI0025F841EF|nr:cellulase family glycosylhydrolase [uncultured Pseudomonas sp.]